MLINKQVIYEIVVNPKKWHLCLRLIALAIFAIISCLGIISFIQAKDFIGLGFSSFLFVWLSCDLSVGLFIRPISAKIGGNEIIINYSLAKSRIFKLDEIAGYSSTLFHTKIKDYRGVLLYFKDGRKIELSEFNLKSVQPICEYLKEKKGILYLGVEISHFEFIPCEYKYKIQEEEDVTRLTKK